MLIQEHAELKKKQSVRKGKAIGRHNLRHCMFMGRDNRKYVSLRSQKSGNNKKFPPFSCLLTSLFYSHLFFPCLPLIRNLEAKSCFLFLSISVISFLQFYVIPPAYLFKCFYLFRPVILYVFSYLRKSS